MEFVIQEKNKLLASVVVIIAFGVIFGSLIYTNPWKGASVPAQTKVADGSWAGAWTRDGSNDFNYSQLSIDTVTPTTFNLDIEAQQGADSGSLTNADDTTMKIVRNGDAADVTSSDSFISLGDATTQCSLHLALSGDTITVSGDESNCDYGAGFDVSYLGTYHRGDDITPVTVQGSDFFSTHASAYPAFAQLTGDSATLFDGYAMNESDSTDAALGADVAEFYLDHAETDTCIIIIAPGNKIWAAVPDYEYANLSNASDTAGDIGTPVVRYFTNVSGWENKLPQTIKDWMNNTDAKGQKVRYMSGKDKVKVVASPSAN
jgi:hypothetical protein